MNTKYYIIVAEISFFIAIFNFIVFQDIQHTIYVYIYIYVANFHYLVYDPKNTKFI